MAFLNLPHPDCHKKTLCSWQFSTLNVQIVNSFLSADLERTLIHVSLCHSWVIVKPNPPCSLNTLPLHGHMNKSLPSGLWLHVKKLQAHLSWIFIWPQQGGRQEISLGNEKNLRVFHHMISVSWYLPQRKEVGCLLPTIPYILGMDLWHFT